MALAGQTLLDAQLDLWQNTFAFVKSMALKSALDLRIAETIQHHGGGATLSQIATRAMVPPAKIPCLSRLMRVLTATGVFSAQQAPSGIRSCEQLLYTLTPMSRLLVGSRNQLRNDHTLWELADRDPAFNALFNSGMESDTEFIMDIVVNEFGEVFHGIDSLIDVGGGHGAAAHAIVKAFPHLKCSVLDLGHVVADAPNDTNVHYIAGDMFETVPPASVIFLKWVLHDWNDEECVKILKNCKKAIPPRDEGGKVVIIDIVIGAGQSDKKQKEMQVVFDLFIMFINGTERDENQWKKIFFEAGFCDYKITPVLGVRSLIEVYP
ncbi:O-methyltransferase ZRP4-like isoform X2 [Panicum hallii]|uniref:O-methyltransferase ZRP4-like isoform X2 n=1 Tax=Panicum hallii TaxID=206008 RepID=UPI000DF4DBB2|nr:O-methyltransferase ZRP4-like isoform X2 [Panicum hallii]